MRKFLIVPLLGLALSGCGLLGSKSKPMDQYTLSPEPTQPAGATTACAAVLRVSSVEAAPPWSGEDLLYTETPYQVSAYAYHRWASPPATMLTDAIVKAVSASGRYRAVLGPTDPGNGDLTLAVRLVRGPLQTFAGEGSASAQSSTESMTLTAALAVTSSGKLLGTKEFSARESAAANPYGGVVAANRLAGRLIGELADWLGQAGGGGLCQTGS